MDCRRQRCSRVRSEWRRRPGASACSSAVDPTRSLPDTTRSFPRVSVADIESQGGALLESLCRVGAVILTPAGGECEKAVAACYSACREFFALPFDDKAAHGAASGPGPTPVTLWKCTAAA